MSAPMWEISHRVRFVVTSPDRVVALHLDRPHERPSALLGTAASIWLQLTDGDGRRLVGGASAVAVIAALADAFDQPSDVIAPDVHSFLHDMETRGFVVRM